MLERMIKIVKVMWMRRGIEAIEREARRREGIREGLEKLKKVMERVEKRRCMVRWKVWEGER
jgi:inactivated superfamily I helicase